MGTHINSSKHTNIICPKCKKIGGSLQKKLINKPISLPKKVEITNLSTAWDYVAKGLLRMRDYVILFPPEGALDEELTQSLYSHYSQFTRHTNAEIHEFELTHLATPAINLGYRKVYFVSQPRKRDLLFADGQQKPPKEPTKHLELPRGTNDIPKASVACLYGAVVCCALRDFSKEVIQKPFTADQNQHFAGAIFSVYSSLFSDARHATSFWHLSKIMADIHNRGYHGAAAVDAVSTGFCLRCYKRGSGQAVEMDRSEDSPAKLTCPKCSSTEELKVPYTSKHLRNREYEMLEKLEVLVRSLPLYFKTIAPMYSDAIQHGPNAKEDFQKCFDKYELQANKNELLRRYRWIITHYDPSQKSRRKQCIISPMNFANIGIKDERYKLYKDSLLELAKSIPKNLSMSQIMKVIDIAQGKEEKYFKEFYDAGHNILKVMGWPEAYIEDKLRYDISYALLTR